MTLGQLSDISFGDQWTVSGVCFILLADLIFTVISKRRAVRMAGVFYGLFVLVCIWGSFFAPREMRATLIFGLKFVAAIQVGWIGFHLLSKGCTRLSRVMEEGFRG